MADWIIDPNSSARQKAAARLDGMDVYKMLDLTGTGEIHQVVLARSLHIFDKSVFTQPIVQEILDGLVAYNPDRTDGKVPLVALVEHLADTAYSSRSIRSIPQSEGRAPSGARTPLQPGQRTPLQPGEPVQQTEQRTPSLQPVERTPSLQPVERTPSLQPVERTPSLQPVERPPLQSGAPSGARTPLQSGERTPLQSGEQTPLQSGERTPSQSGERTPTMAEEMNESVNAYTDSLVCDIKGFNDIVKPEDLVAAAGTSPEEIAELRAQLKAHAKQYVIDAQRRNICPLWYQFDTQGNGVLDTQTCIPLVAAYLHAMARKASEIIRGSIELGIELSLIISEKTVKDDAKRQQMRTHARLQVEAIHANVAPLVQQMLDTMADEDPHTIAGELLATIDLNSNGQVTRDEFEQRFVESMQYVLGPEGLMDKLAARNSLQ